jgi:succinate-acetate transporter protein
VVLRPLATPLPLGFLALFSATSSLAVVQLHWVPATAGRPVALAALALTVPLQLIASVMGFLARDPVAATGMGVLAGTWAAVGLSVLSSPPGSTSPGLGTVLVMSGLAMLVPAVAGRHKVVASAVMGLSALRFLVTGVAHLSGGGWTMRLAGWVGLALGALALYAATAFELEGVGGRGVLPLLRRGDAAAAVSPDVQPLVPGREPEPGVRPQL